MEEENGVLDPTSDSLGGFHGYTYAEEPEQFSGFSLECLSVSLLLQHPPFFFGISATFPPLSSVLHVNHVSLIRSNTQVCRVYRDSASSTCCSSL